MQARRLVLVNPVSLTRINSASAVAFALLGRLALADSGAKQQVVDFLSTNRPHWRAFYDERLMGVKSLYNRLTLYVWQS